MRNFKRDKQKYDNLIEAYRRKNDLLIRWIKNIHQGISVSEYLEQENIHTIAIYGHTPIAECFADELLRSNIKVKYIIDRNPAFDVYKGIETVGLDTDFHDVDLIVITVVEYYDEIEETLSKITNAKVAAIDDLIFSA
jgi:hypothetical protein